MANKKCDNEWYKNAVIYGLDFETFFDSDGDGIGDIRGATAKLEYLAWLGVNCIWLLPFYLTQDKDNGYDVTGYVHLDARLGTFTDLREFFTEAKKRNFRILLDLVIHHTSDQHPWFVAATEDPGSKYYNYYIWTKQLPPKPHDKNIFPGEEDSVWHYNSEVNAYYHHKFYHYQPDLNITNVDVQSEIFSIVDFWLTFPIDGFRVDAATHLLEEKKLPGAMDKDPTKFIESLYKFMKKRSPDAILLGEADVVPEKIKAYFETGDRFQLLFNFLLNNNLFLSLATKNAGAVEKCLKELTEIAPTGRWANFVRNLDELDLEQLTPEEQEIVCKTFAPEPTMRIYGRGIRRRIAPMLNGNMRQLRFVFSLLYSFSGAPLIVYGDEIGMGDNLALKDRVAVRTSMQWDDSPNAGFSTAKKDRLVLPVIDYGRYGYKKINVQKQKNDASSLLHFFKTITALRKRYPEVGEGLCKVLSVKDEGILGLQYTGKDRTIVIFHNFSDTSGHINSDEFTSSKHSETFHDGEYAEDGKDTKLHGYGYRWFVKEND